MSLLVDIGGKRRAAGRYINQIRRRLITTVLNAEEQGITRAEIARRIGCDRARITRQLNGNSNITLRSIAEIAWAVGKKPTSFELIDIFPEDDVRNNIHMMWDDHHGMYRPGMNVVSMEPSNVTTGNVDTRMQTPRAPRAGTQLALQVTAD